MLEGEARLVQVSHSLGVCHCLIGGVRAGLTNACYARSGGSLSVMIPAAKIKPNEREISAT